MPRNLQLLWWDGAKANIPNPLCGSALASSLSQHRLLVICPQQLTKTHWSMDGQSQRIQADDAIGRYGSTIAQTWVHEWGHLIRDCTSHLLHDTQSPSLTRLSGDDESRVNRLGLPVYGLHGRKDTYGWAPSYYLAKFKNQEAQVSPENYCYFAAATYWSDWYWGTGYAKPAPEGSLSGHSRRSAMYAVSYTHLTLPTKRIV